MLRYWSDGLELSVTQSMATLTIWGLEYYAYVGILDNAVNRSPGDKSLVGGSSLDLLALVLFVQFGSLIWSKLFWLLSIVPVWGAYNLYTMFGGGLGGSSGSAASEPPQAETEEQAARRQQRAEKRRQKRM